MSQANVPGHLQQLLDRSEITDLVYRLGVCLDEGRFDEMRTLFVEEATARTPGGTAEGREALVAQARRNHRSDERIQHVTTNLLVAPDGDRATVRANLVVHFAPSGDPAGGAAPAPPARFVLGEVYRFDVVRTPQGWRFSRVETSPVWMSGSLDRRPQRASATR
jgi:SnoaL-like domain